MNLTQGAQLRFRLVLIVAALCHCVRVFSRCQLQLTSIVVRVQFSLILLLCARCQLGLRITELGVHGFNCVPVPCSLHLTETLSGSNCLLELVTPVHESCRNVP